MSQSPRLDTVIEAAINQRLESFWTAIPAKVSSYNHSTQRATIKITISNAVKDGSGEKRWYKPTIQNVPVLFPGSTSAGDDYRITYPMSSFSNGLYIVSSLPTDAWRLTDNDVDLELEAGSTNHLASGFLIPADTKHSISDAPVDAMVLWGKKVKIGGADDTEPTIKADTWQSDFGDVIDIINDAFNSLFTALGSVTEPPQNVVKLAWLNFKTTSDYKTKKAEVK